MHLIPCATMYVCLYKNSLKEKKKNHDGGSIEFITGKPIEFNPAAMTFSLVSISLS